MTITRTWCGWRRAAWLMLHRGLLLRPGCVMPHRSPATLSCVRHPPLHTYRKSVRPRSALALHQDNILTRQLCCFRRIVVSTAHLAADPWWRCGQAATARSATVIAAAQSLPRQHPGSLHRMLGTRHVALQPPLPLSILHAPCATRHMRLEPTQPCGKPEHTCTPRPWWHSDMRMAAHLRS